MGIPKKSCLSVSSSWFTSNIYGTKSYLSVQCTGNPKQGLVHFIRLWNKKIDIPEKSCLKNHVYLFNIQITQSRAWSISYIYNIKMFVCATYRWRKGTKGIKVTWVTKFIKDISPSATIALNCGYQAYP